MPETPVHPSPHAATPQRAVYSARTPLDAAVARARSVLAPRTDRDLEAAALAARATLGDRDAIRELTYRPTRRKTGDLSRAGATVYRCSCRAIITGPEARCRRCGSTNTVNARAWEDDSMMSIRPTDADEAIEYLRVNAGQVAMSVGTDPEDPVLVIYYDPCEEPDCRIVSMAVGGWSAGITEPVCSPDSDFLRTFLTERGTETLVLIEDQLNR